MLRCMMYILELCGLMPVSFDCEHLENSLLKCRSFHMPVQQSVDSSEQ